MRIVEEWPGMGIVERVTHIAMNADRIYVRAKIDGSWQSVALSELPETEKFSETKRLAARVVPPTMVIG